MGFFRNEREDRPRALWRLLFHYALYTVGQTLLVTVALALFSLRAGSVAGLALSSSPASSAVIGVVSLVAAVGSVWLAGRFLDRRPFSGFGFELGRGWWADLGFGLILGALLMTGIFLVELAAGWVTVTGTFVAPDEGVFVLALVPPLVLFVCAGIYEELIFRGYRIKNLAEGLNFPVLGPRGAILLAWALTSLYFGLRHAFNPNATLVSTTNIALAGVLLGIGYVLTGQLAIPIGVHVTWNFFQGNVYGFPVSGLKTIGGTFVETEQAGPVFLTGGVFGPEAGLVGVGTMVVGSVLIALWVRLRSGEASLETSIAEPPVRKP